ncbi:MAG: hypothetical protein K0S68_22 [Candidatus Saccharibacteria bacterium]|jgi:hypothetical protein|nr:hypothetical protein [Candidatus Saccharibacteria bacterium]
MIIGVLFQMASIIASTPLRAHRPALRERRFEPTDMVK